MLDETELGAGDANKGHGPRLPEQPGYSPTEQVRLQPVIAALLLCQRAGLKQSQGQALFFAFQHHPIESPGKITGRASPVEGSAQSLRVEITDFFIPEFLGPNRQGRPEGGIDVPIPQASTLAEQGEQGLVVAGL